MCELHGQSWQLKGGEPGKLKGREAALAGWVRQLEEAGHPSLPRGAHRDSSQHRAVSQ